MKLLRFVLFAPFILLSVDFPVKQFHNATYKFGWDINGSPYAGGEDILFVHRAIERGEGYLMSLGSIYYSTAPSARFWRLSELYFAWLPLNVLAVVAQHEIFGHGYRIRDINQAARVTGYSFDAPPPYGSGGGATHYRLGDSFTTTDETCVAMGGVESTAILALQTKFKWLESHRIDPRQTVLYLLSQHDLNLYIGTLKASKEADLPGHDIQAYIKALNYTYTNHFLSSGRLRSLSWINLADPFTYYSIYAWFRYIASGKETHIPMMKIFGWGYLPTLRLGLTPFGPEVFYESFLNKGERSVYFYMTAGHHSDNTYGGLGFYAPRLWKRKNWFAGLRFDAWRQPKLLLQEGNTPFEEIDLKPNKEEPLYPYSQQHAMRNGAAGSFIFAYQGRSGFEVELGLKSEGFLPGYSLRARPTARLFYTLIF